MSYRSDYKNLRSDQNHWYSSSYWRSNLHKVNTFEVCRQTNPKEMLDNRKTGVQPEGHLIRPDLRPDLRPHIESNSRPDLRPHIESNTRPDLRPHIESNTRPDLRSHIESNSRPDLRPHIESNSRPDLRSHTESNSRLGKRKADKRSNDCIEVKANQKRLRIKDPFDSPNSMIKDFRLNDDIALNSVHSMPELFCKTCQIEYKTSLDYSNHLSGKRHQTSLDSTQVKKSTRIKDSEECNPLQRLVQQMNESIVGLNYMKEMREGVFDCHLCNCYQMTVLNAFQHIKGYRHQRNFSTLKETEERRKRSDDRQKRHTGKNTVCSSTQTCDDLREQSCDQSGDQSQSPTTRTTKSNVVSSKAKTSSKDRDRGDHQMSSDSQQFDSCKKTIENFKYIREICDKMIGYYSEKQKSSTNVLSTTGETSNVCLPSKIKREK